MTVTAQPIVDLGQCWQGAEFPIEIKFYNGDTLSDPPTPKVIASSMAGPNPPEVRKPPLTRLSAGDYTFDSGIMDIPGTWTVTVHGGWANEETPSVATLVVLEDPNYDRWSE